MARRPKLTDAEREQRRAQDRERLKQASEQLLSSDGWRRWVRLRSRAGLARLSLSNQLLVALACPDATFVAGFKAWLELGYCVRKGEKAIRIIAPLKVKERDRTTGEETGEMITLFKTVFVFDAQQVEPLPSGQPTPLEPPCQPLTGDSHAHLIAPARTFAESLGYTVSLEPIAGWAGGWCDTKRKRIVVDSGGPPNAQLRTLTHEVIHALGVDYQHYSRAQAEVIVDTTTLVVLGGLGLDVSGETAPYVAGWGEDGALEAVTEFAQLIDTLARRVETALSASDAAAGSGGRHEHQTQGHCI
jgi:N-terminal domain of anti-restriction factor ArdC